MWNGILNVEQSSYVLRKTIAFPNASVLLGSHLQLKDIGREGQISQTRRPKYICSQAPVVTTEWSALRFLA